MLAKEEFITALSNFLLKLANLVLITGIVVVCCFASLQISQMEPKKHGIFNNHLKKKCTELVK